MIKSNIFDNIQNYVFECEDLVNILIILIFLCTPV